jgi:hypothetical protein
VPPLVGKIFYCGQRSLESRGYLSESRLTFMEKLNELTKLIEEAFYDTVSADPHTGNLCGKEAFIERVNEILATRPTCGQEQRKFLDEVENKYKFQDIGMGVLVKKKNWRHDITEIMQKDFDSDLSKVIKGN